MPYLVKLAIRAERDLNDLYEHVNASVSGAAARWFNEIEEAILSLERLPRRCPLMTESRKFRRTLRHLLYGNKPNLYRIIFEIDEPSQVVLVLTIRHGARDEARSGAF